MLRKRPLNQNNLQQLMRTEPRHSKIVKRFSLKSPSSKGGRLRLGGESIVSSVLIGSASWPCRRGQGVRRQSNRSHGSALAERIRRSCAQPGKKMIPLASKLKRIEGLRGSVQNVGQWLQYLSPWLCLPRRIS